MLKRTSLRTTDKLSTTSTLLFKMRLAVATNCNVVSETTDKHAVTWVTESVAIDKVPDKLAES